jgi:hypothetical protein
LPAPGAGLAVVRVCRQNLALAWLDAVVDLDPCRRQQLEVGEHAAGGALVQI